MITRRVHCAVTIAWSAGRPAACSALFARDGPLDGLQAAWSRLRPAPSRLRPAPSIRRAAPSAAAGPPVGWPASAARPPGPPSPGPARPSREVGTTAHTVVPRSSARTPQLEHRCSTMPRPRPPMEDSDGREARGRVALPPSLTMISTAAAVSIQEIRMQEPGSGRACRIALLSSSLVTRAASAVAVVESPAWRSSAPIRPRATATLDGTHGSRTTLAALTPLRAPPRGRDSRLPSSCERDAPPAGPGNRVPRERVDPGPAAPAESVPGHSRSRLA